MSSKASTLPDRKQSVRHTYIDTRVAGSNDLKAAAYAVQVAPVVIDQAMKARAQTHVIDAEAPLPGNGVIKTGYGAQRSKPIPIPQRNLPSPTSSSCPQRRHIQVPNNKQSYVVGQHSRHSSYVFGPGKLNNLTLTGLKDRSFKLDAAISGVDIINCRNIIVEVARTTFCNVELSSDIVIKGPAIVEVAKSIDVALNGKILPASTFEDTRHLDVDGFIGEELTDTLPLPIP